MESNALTSRLPKMSGSGQKLSMTLIGRRASGRCPPRKCGGQQKSSEHDMTRMGPPDLGLRVPTRALYSVRAAKCLGDESGRSSVSIDSSILPATQRAQRGDRTRAPRARILSSAILRIRNPVARPPSTWNVMSSSTSSPISPILVSAGMKAIAAGRSRSNSGSAPVDGVRGGAHPETVSSLDDLIADCGCRRSLPAPRTRRPA